MKLLCVFNFIGIYLILLTKQTNSHPTLLLKANIEDLREIVQSILPEHVAMRATDLLDDAIDYAKYAGKDALQKVPSYREWMRSYDGSKKEKSNDWFQQKEFRSKNHEESEKKHYNNDNNKKTNFLKDLQWPAHKSLEIKQDGNRVVAKFNEEEGDRKKTRGRYGN